MKLRFVVSILCAICMTATGRADVVINEIMYRPVSLLVEDEFIEILNTGESDVDLSGWSFSDGVDFLFPQGMTLDAGAYLVVASSPGSFKRLYPNVDALGPYEGRLSNDGEKLELSDALGNTADLVSYRDEVGWPPDADGLGPSIERIHPQMLSSQPESWRTGPNGGTPGKPNASAVGQPVPIVTSVKQRPVTPTSSETVHINCTIHHPLAIQKVTAFYKRETDNVFQETELFDDGLHGDHRAGDRLYGGEFPALPDRSIVEFYIHAEDETGQQGMFPSKGPKRAAIYRVDDSEYTTDLPIYRIIMRDADERLLRSRNAYSNDELDASFVYRSDIYYNVGVRFRGKGSRNRNPKSYRVNFSNTRHFGSVRKLNLNAFDIYRQFVGIEVFKTLQMPCPEKRFVSVLFNQRFENSYLQVERTGEQMMDRIFGDGSGNLYRGVEQANLDYRGENPNSYRGNYVKVTNELQDDYTGLIRMCEAHSNPDDRTYKAGLDRRINTAQWIRWFAIKKILNDLEGGLSKERGDDYYLYHFPQDDRFYLLLWDMDSVLVRPFRGIHQYDTPAVKRLVTHPDLARMYYAELVNILEKELPQTAMDAIIDQAAPAANEAVRNDMKNVSRELREFILSSIPRKLTADVAQTFSRPIIEDGAVWRFFRGKTAPPADWKENDFDDASWETGPGGIGYGDGDDRTVLSDMRNNYTTVFIRKTFDIDNPSAYRQFMLNVLYDDSFVAYLNGTEVARANFSGVPAFRSLADGSHEASSVELFPIANPASLLVPGQNTLALAGINTALTSSDLSLAVSLDGVRVSEVISELRGQADAARTRWIHINGASAPYDPMKAEWSSPVLLEPGRNIFRIEALDEFANVFDSTNIVLYKDAAPPTDGRETYGDEVWNETLSPMTVEQNIIVPKTDSLTIDPGVTVRMAPGTAIIVYGTLTVNGTDAKPVRFESSGVVPNWGGIAIEGAAGEAKISHAQFSHTKPFSFRSVNYSGAVSVHDSTAVIEHSFFTAAEGVGIDAKRSTMTIRQNHFKSMGEMVHCMNCFTIVVNNLFENAIGYSDAIDLDGQMGPPSVIRGNTILHSEDDGIDLGKTSAMIEGNWIQGCSDKGISLEGQSEILLINNVVFQSNLGIGVKDRCQAQLIHNTIASCTTGIRVYEKNAGQGGASADVLNCVIWDTTQSIDVDEKSTVDVRNSNLMQLSDAFAQGNISADPQFLDLANGQLSIHTDSPLIDAGAKSDIATDIDRNKRPSRTAPDIGAYEFQQPTDIADWEVY